VNLKFVFFLPKDEISQQFILILPGVLGVNESKCRPGDRSVTVDGIFPFGPRTSAVSLPGPACKVSMGTSFG